MSTEMISIIVVLIAGFVGLYLALQYQLRQSQPKSNELEDMVNKVFGMSVARIAAQSKQILQSEKETIKTDLDNKQQVIEKLVKQVQQDLQRQQDELHLLEKERTKQFGHITTAIDEHRKLTDELKVSTKQLATVLSNNQQRGEWGERIIEDLMQANGLIEGVHYVRQSKLGTSTLRPDITLLLPNKRNVAVDVKFPYSEIQKMAIAETKDAKQAHLKQFAIDLKQKITKVALYIDPSQDTLDYAILFVPNEMVFSFINQQFPDLVDEAMGKRVMIVSPFTFLIVARTVMESYRNFMVGDKLKEVVKYIDEFVGEWSKFKEKFDKYGRSLHTLQSDYEELTSTRIRQMDRKIDKVQSYRQGQLAGGKDVELLDE
jgi:DNA recombination protein RmuC